MYNSTSKHAYTYLTVWGWTRHAPSTKIEGARLFTGQGRHAHGWAMPRETTPPNKWGVDLHPRSPGMANVYMGYGRTSPALASSGEVKVGFLILQVFYVHDVTFFHIIDDA